MYVAKLINELSARLLALPLLHKLALYHLIFFQLCGQSDTHLLGGLPLPFALLFSTLPLERLLSL